MGFSEKLTMPYKKVTHHTINLHGEKIEYDAVAEDHFISSENSGEDGYSIFTVSYFRTNDENPCRPVLFFFNGGPGSPCSWLHMGFYGPRLMKLDDHGMPVANGPCQLRDNEQCLLDMVDLVAIDPVNAGYSRSFDQKFEPEFKNDMPDALSVSKAIRQWISLYHKEANIKFISGESFGSTRASLLAWLLQDLQPVAAEIHIGPGYTGNTDIPRNLKDLPPLAATKWYYEKEKKETLDARMKKCYEFLYQEYLPAWHQGSQCPKETMERIARRLEYFTGLSSEYYMEHRLFVSREYFREHFLEKEGKRLGSYDTRFTLPLGTQQDPFMAAFDGPIEECRHLYYEQELSVSLEKERGYRPWAMEGDAEYDWEFTSDPDMAKANALAYEKNPGLRFFFGTGRYDSVATIENTRYAVTHTDIPFEAVTMKEYESGHAVYADERSRLQLAKDIREFIERVLKERENASF